MSNLQHVTAHREAKSRVPLLNVYVAFFNDDHLHIVAMCRIRGALPLLPLYVSVAHKGNFTFYDKFTYLLIYLLTYFMKQSP